MYEHNYNSHEKLNPCDLAIKKYGLIKEIEILEEIDDLSLLDEKEKYYIELYKSYNKDIGYNLTKGGNCYHLCGENNVNASFTNAEVLDIRKRRFEGERKKDVYKDYLNKSFGGFEKIWLGKGYEDIGQEYMIPVGSISRQTYSSEANKGLKNGRCKVSIEDIQNIRKRFDEGESIILIAKDYENKISKSTVRRIAKRESFKDI